MSFLTTTILNPLFTLPVLVGFHRHPDMVQALISRLPAQLASSPRLTPTALRSAAAVALGLGLIRVANAYASRRALNCGEMRDTWDWEKEVVVVTGGSGGLGDMLVRQFAARGVTVVSLDIVEPKEELPSNAFFYKTDITSSSAISEAAAKIRANHGDPTVLINNAGVASWSTILDSSEEDIRRTFDVNTISYFLTVKEFLPYMVKKNHGHVVTLASIASYVTIAQNVDYSASKAAVMALHEGLKQELKHRYNAPRVRTTAIHPIFVATPLINKISGNQSKTDKLFKTVLQPHQVVNAIFKQVMKGESANIVLPEELSISRLLRGLPWWLQERLRDQQKGVSVDR